jgi:hypothetical protein
MGYMFGFFLIVAIVTSTIAILVSFPPARIARVLRMTVPILMIAAGGVLTIIGRGAFGLPLVVAGAGWLMRTRRTGRPGRGTSPGAKSTVRSAWFEMELDHDSGDLDGIVLTGRMEGRRLSQLSLSELLALYAEAASDAESGQLLEAYLDRRMPGWRENAQAHSGSRQGGAAGAGPMTKEEAYQVLGLGPGAGPKEVHEAHRRLMKRVHPDSGGSTFLAAKINEAKDVLLD